MGVEGPTDDPEIIAARERQKRNLLATLFLSQGVPMLCGGDEIGRTQNGQQQRLLPGQRDQLVRLETWMSASTKLLEFTRQLIEFRKAHPNLRRRKFFQDREVLSLIAQRTSPGTATTGEEMTPEQWSAGWMRSMAVLFNGNTLGEVDDMGQPIMDDSFLILLNSYHEGVTYTLPQSPQSRGWKLVMDTNNLDSPFGERTMEGALDVAGRSVVLLRELALQGAQQPEAESAEVPQVVHTAADEAPAEPEPVLAEPSLVDVA